MSTPNVRARTRSVSLNEPTASASSPPAAASFATCPTSLALKIAYRPTASLKPSARNARTHSRKQIHKIAASLKKFGFINPVLINGEGEVVAGHGRLAAAKELGIVEIPTISLDHMSEADLRAYRIADNQLATLAGWDNDILKIEFGYLSEFEIELPEITGFETPQIDLILNPATPAPDKASSLDDVPAADPSCRAVSHLGDLWLLNDHRLICGDARSPDVYRRLFDGEEAQMVFTDPPYNCAISKHVCGLGKVQHREFAMASGEMSNAQFGSFLSEVLTQIHAVMADGALIYACMDWRGLNLLLNAGEAIFDELKNIICWTKTNGGMGSLYRSAHELIVLWKKGKAPHINNVELGKHGRYRTNSWSYAGVNTFRSGRMEELSSHPTVKPCAMVMDAIKDCSKPRGIILDAFGGSGTTLIAAEKTKRRGYLVELDEIYVDVTVRRWEKLTGKAAIHAETGLSFAETALERQREAASTSGIIAADAGEVGHVA